MPHNTKLAFRSFKKGSEKEKLMQIEQFLKVNFLQSYTDMFFYFIDLVIKSMFFAFRSLNYRHSNPQLCIYFTWKTM